MLKNKQNIEMGRTLSFIKLDFGKIKTHFIDGVFKDPYFRTNFRNRIYHSNLSERFLLSFDEIQEYLDNNELSKLNAAEWSILYYEFYQADKEHLLFGCGFEKIYSFNSSTSSTIAKQEYLNYFDPFDKETSLTMDGLITFGEFKVFIKWLCTLTAIFNSEIYDSDLSTQFLQSNTIFNERARLRYNFEVKKKEIIERRENDDYSELHNYYDENQAIFDYVGHQDINGNYFCPIFIGYFYSLIELNTKISTNNGELSNYDSGRILVLDSY